MKTASFSEYKTTMWVVIATVIVVVMTLACCLLLPGLRAEREQPQVDEDTAKENTDETNKGADPSAPPVTPIDGESGTASVEPLLPQGEEEKQNANNAEETGNGAPSSEGILSKDAVEDMVTTQPPTDTVPVPIIQISGSVGLIYRSYGNGTCILEGLGSCTDTCVIVPSCSPEGDEVITIAAGAFMGSAIEAVQLPATLRNIGVSAFGDCKQLKLFAVPEENTSFCVIDGVLYSKDKKALIAYPAGRGCPVMTIPRHVRYVAEMAFAACPSLKKIRFEGTVAQWQRVQISDKNTYLFTLPMEFLDDTE